MSLARTLAIATVALALGLVAVSSPAGAASGVAASTRSATRTTGWTQIGSYVENTLNAGEGVATVDPVHGRGYELYRGLSSVTPSLASMGWSHIGDPDSFGGYIFDAYQGPSSGDTKMFLVTTPAGETFQYVHTLVAGELYNNSFASISPGGQWMVAGEWNTMTHLQIYPTPLLNHRTSRRGGVLHLSGYIRLDHRVDDIQGCDFVSPKKLICASDDASKTLFRNEMPVLEVDLAHSLRSGSMRGHVVDLGSIPQQSRCSGTFEPEGVDYDGATGILRVEIIQPGGCILSTTIYKYRRAL